MIYCAELDQHFETKELMFEAMKGSVNKIIADKRAMIKTADPYGIITVSGDTPAMLVALKGLAMKAANPFVKAEDLAKETTLPRLKVISIANTTNWFDSHHDVHIDDIWNKTLADNGLKGFKHLQEHKDGFAHVISDDAKVFIENTTFKALGFNYDGTTQALKGISIIDPNRNLFMYNQYANKWVRNHSVGMRYVKLLYCANSEMESMKEYKYNWDKYYKVIANKEDVDAVGYFFAVLEAKLCEYSAVVDGSNRITPTETIELEADDSLDADKHEADKTLPDNDQEPAAIAWKQFLKR